MISPLRQWNRWLLQIRVLHILIHQLQWCRTEHQPENDRYVLHPEASRRPSRTIVSWTVKNSVLYGQWKKCHITSIVVNSLSSQSIAVILPSDKATPPTVGSTVATTVIVSKRLNVAARRSTQMQIVYHAYHCRRRRRLKPRVSAIIDTFYEGQLETLPVIADMVRRMTQTDPVLSQVYEFTVKGWPDKVAPDLQPYWIRRNELFTSQGCLTWVYELWYPSEYSNNYL